MAKEIIEEQKAEPSKNELEAVVKRTSDLVISSKETYEIAGVIISDITKYEKKVKDYWENPLTGPLFKAKETVKTLKEKYDQLMAPAKEMKKTVQDKMNAYLTEQARIAREQQRKLDEERKAREDAERQKAEKAAAKARAEAEELRKKEELSEKEKKRIEKLEEKAVAQDEKAANVFIPPAYVKQEVDKTTRTDGATISAKKDIEVVINDPIEVIKLVASGIIPLDVVAINQYRLKKWVEAEGKTELPGCAISEIVKGQVRSK